jgi:hypothetical protein
MGTAKNPLRTGAKRCFVEVVRFFPNTAADPAYTDDGGVVSSIVHTDTGKYTITLRDLPYRILAVVPTISVVGDATDATAQGGVESTTAGTIVVKTKTGSANADFAADASTHVDVLIYWTPALADT